MPRLTIEQLVQRATGGEKFNRHNLFRPSLTYYLLKDPFWLWCEYHAPKAEAIDETTRYDELRMEHGIEHEVRWVRANFPAAVEIKPGFGFDALKNTFRAMLDGARVIYQPQLWDLRQETYGKGDLLIRDDSAPSDLGPYHYRVVELKRSRTLREYHVQQAGFYNQIIPCCRDIRPVTSPWSSMARVKPYPLPAKKWLWNSLASFGARCAMVRSSRKPSAGRPGRRNRRWRHNARRRSP
jgi:predicted RecB family nuclease